MRLSSLAVLLFLKLYEACDPPYYYVALPSHGDVMLCDSGLVMIYMGPDGTNMNHMWGTISGEFWTLASDTLCQQLGYGKGEIRRGDSFNETQGHPVWLSNVQCNSNQTGHILRCQYDFNIITEHDDDWYLTCGSFSTREVERKADYGNTYDGQMAIIPFAVLIRDDRNFSRSLGVVVVKLQKHWKFFGNDSSLFDLNTADTVCRSMGYTHAVKNSVTTAAQYNRAYNFEGHYDYSFNTSSLSALPASEMRCSEATQCIGCCLNLAQDAAFQVVTNDLDAIVLRCSFYTSFYESPSDIIPSGGYREICEVATNGSMKRGNVCVKGKPEVTFSKNTFIDTVTPLSSVLIFFIAATVVLFIALIIVVYKCKHPRPRGEYNRLLRPAVEDRGPPPDEDGNVNDGNGNQNVRDRNVGDEGGDEGGGGSGNGH